MSIVDLFRWDDLVAERNQKMDRQTIEKAASDYRTYLLGTEAFYNKEIVESLSRTIRAPYFSNWRVLHVDGFEPMYRPLPASSGHKIQFYFASHRTAMADKIQFDGMSDV